jgi:hypothetical protein
MRIPGQWRLVPFVAVLLWAFAPAAGSDAATLHVANNGVDGFACGAADSPCRSISRAIALAATDDTIIVGPGRYGDVNGDGDFDDPGDEAAELEVGSCLCLVKVNKRGLTIRSRDGAAATVVDAGGLPVSVVHVEADDATVGSRRGGFTLIGGHRGISVDAGTRRVTVDGNLAIIDAGDPSTDLDAGLFDAAFVIDGTLHRARYNAAIANPAFGFVILGDRHRVEGNLASVSRQQGFYLPVGSEGHTLVSGFAIANGYDGIFVDVGGHARSLSQNVLVGNRGAGIALDRIAEGPIVVRGNNIYGNDVSNCGLWNNNPGMSIDATKNFWGFAGGPFEDPGDEVCNIGDSETVTDPFADEEFPRRRWGSLW